MSINSKKSHELCLLLYANIIAMAYIIADDEGKIIDNKKRTFVLNMFKDNINMNYSLLKEEDKLFILTIIIKLNNVFNQTKKYKDQFFKLIGNEILVDILINGSTNEKGDING